MNKSLTFIMQCFTVFCVLLVIAFAVPSGLTNINNTVGIDLRLLVMFLLAEPHFAMTIPLLYGYRHNFLKKKLEFLVYPTLIITAAIILFYFNLMLFSLVFLFANVYHVNRQSRAFLMLQTGVKRKFAEIYEWCLHTSVLVFFFLRFMDFESKVMLLLIACLFLISLSYAFWYSIDKRSPDVKKNLSFIQGFLIFLPIVVFEDLLLAFAVGISIHYIQYLTISWPVCRKSFGWSATMLVGFLLGYSLLSSGALGGFFSRNHQSLIILIPTTLQLLHFYFDGLIWKRSDPLVNEKLTLSSI